MIVVNGFWLWLVRAENGGDGLRDAGKSRAERHSAFRERIQRESGRRSQM